MKKIIIFCVVLSFILVGNIFGRSEGKITLVKGKVDVKLTEASKWEKAKEGMIVREGSVISTGVRSSAVIDIDGISLIIVRPMTQFSFDTLNIRNAPGKDGNDVSLKLKIGTVKAKVAKSESVKTDFKVKTPKGTASVRGTIKEVSYFPGYGMEVRCFRGEVEVESLLESKVSIMKDESTEIKEDSNNIATWDEQKFDETRPDTHSFDLTDAELEALAIFGDPMGYIPADGINTFIDYYQDIDREKL